MNIIVYYAGRFESHNIQIKILIFRFDTASGIFPKTYERRFLFIFEITLVALATISFIIFVR